MTSGPTSGTSSGSRWSRERVERAAPDTASLAAARRLATPGPWSDAGATDTLVWGRCQGSGRTPYQVSVDLTGPAYRCSCPSRKFPCKHAVALLLLWSSGRLGTDGVAAAAPDEARQWAEQRAARAADAAGREARPARAVDPDAQARRRAERLRLMDDGVDDLGTWLTDLVRGGLAEARRRPYAWWDAAAARLVDAQLPGLAEHVRDVGAGLAGRDDWADHLLHEVGRWWTVVSAWRRREHLDPRTLADLRVVVGWSVPSEEVRRAEEVVDRWQVLGAHRSDDGRLQQQRTWLRGVDGGETVVLLDFAGRGQPLATARLVGSVLTGAVARYPGSPPRRALLVDEPVVADAAAPLPPGVGLDEAQSLLAHAWAENPWVRRVPVVLDPAAVSVAEGLVRDDDGATVPLLDVERPFDLAALTGGHPGRVFGELEAGGFRPLTVEPSPPGDVA
ncbi:SWIM zinc finger family protein [Nocardioides marinquilinus]|uniref:SWIM zinc finger family protein n=1 Tax=Nocardioides marinquilinus TaxID=1210400 RepID=A0ABP9Q6L3_9ACTN